MQTSKKIQLLFLLLSALIIFSGCSMTSATEEQQPPQGTYLVTSSDTEINKLIRYLQSSEVELENMVNASTGENADAIRAEIAQLQNNLFAVDAELSNALANNKITNEAKLGYDTAIEGLRTDLDQLNQTLTQKLNPTPTQ